MNKPVKNWRLPFFIWICSVLTLFILLSLFIGWFYWFQWRPVQIRKDCMLKLKKFSKENNIYTPKSTTVFYRMCLIEQGLKPEDLIPSTLLD